MFVSQHEKGRQTVPFTNGSHFCDSWLKMHPFSSIYRVIRTIPKPFDKTSMKIRITRLLTALTIFLMLQGCAEVIVAGGAAVVITTFDPRPMATLVTDQTSDFRVGRLLKKDKHIDEKAHINTLVYNHTLLLTGEVRSKWLKQYVSDLVKKVGDIKTIHNYLRITKPSAEANRTEDAALTMQLMARLSSSDIDDTEVRVVTEGKRVYIMGLVDKATQDKVVQIAKGMHKVKKVVPLFNSAG